MNPLVLTSNLRSPVRSHHGNSVQPWCVAIVVLCASIAVPCRASETVARSLVVSTVSSDCVGVLAGMAKARHGADYPIPPGDLILIKDRCTQWANLVADVPQDPIPIELADWITVSMVAGIRDNGVDFVVTGRAIDPTFGARMATVRATLRDLTADHSADLIRTRDSNCAAAAAYDRDLLAYTARRFSQCPVISLDGLDSGLFHFALAISELDRSYPDPDGPDTPRDPGQILSDVRSEGSESRLMTGAFACCLVKQFDADCGAQWRAFYSLLSPSYSNPVASGPGDPDKEKAEAYTQLESALSVSDGVTHVNLGAIQGWMLKYTQKQAQVFQIRPGESRNNNGFAITFTSNAEEWHAMEAAPSPFAGATALSWIIRPWGSR